MNKALFLALFFNFISLSSKAIMPDIIYDEPVISEQDTVKVGVYVNKIYDIDYVKGSYKASFTVFTNSFSFMYELGSYMDIVDCIDYTLYSEYIDSTRLVDGRKCYWSSIGVIAEISKDFNSVSFPFDHDTLTVSIEFNYSYSSYLKIVLDRAGSSLSNFKLPNWIISDADLRCSESVFMSTFGDPNIVNNTTKFNLIEVKYIIARDSGSVFIKLFTALFISFLLGASSVLLNHAQIEAKLTLIVGGVFGAIGNKYITEDLMPFSSAFTLADKVHDLTLLYLVIMVLYAIYVQSVYAREESLGKVYPFVVLIITYSISVIAVYN